MYITILITFGIFVVFVDKMNAPMLIASATR